MENKLLNKTIIWNGDSICEGFEATGNWATRIAANNNMTYKNYAVGGGTITDGLRPMKNGPRHSVLRTVDEMYKEFPQADYVILEGGTNDADLITADDSTSRLGSVDPDDFSGEYDLSTFCGSLETLFYKALKYWHGKKIGYVIPQKMGTAAKSRRVRRAFFEKAIEICRKWGIPYVDLWENCYLNPCLPWMVNLEKTEAENIADNICYYAYAQHLTGRGYDVTAEIIETWLKTL